MEKLTTDITNPQFTVDGFNELTSQQMFDMAVEHIQKTRMRSQANDLPGCSYSGIGCAASVFLKPEYREKADSTGSGSWYSLINYGVASSHNAELISFLQSAHDDTTSGKNSEKFMREWNSGMRQAAALFDIDTSKLENL
jgi:hypothetical protein